MKEKNDQQRKRVDSILTDRLSVEQKTKQVSRASPGSGFRV
jgi:hypothetical protein